MSGTSPRAAGSGSGSGSGHASSRAPVNHCPYCGEETLRPVEEPAGAWTCLSCLRLFAVTYHGLRRTPAPGASAEVRS